MPAHKKKPCRAALLLSIALILGMCSLALPQMAQKARAASVIGLNTPARISKLIYLTLGNPAIIKKGDKLTIEFDPREGNFKDTTPPQATGWRVFVTSANDPYPLTKELVVDGLSLGKSTRWPELAIDTTGYDKRVYHVTVTVPASLPEDLFDLTVKAKVNGSWTEDSQANALKAVDAFKDRFSFVQLTDIHVFGPEYYFPPATDKTMRNKRHVTYSETDGYGAEYYHKAIQQINLMNPD